MTKRIVFMGTPDFSVPVLESLIQSTYEVVAVVTQPDRPKGRKRVLTPSPVKDVALKHDIPAIQPEKIRHDYNDILAYNPDLIVTAAYGQILPKAILEEPDYGCVNVHASLLPELRGGAPVHYAIIQGKKETGITIMYMAEALDAGDIISQRSVPIEEDDHVGSLHDKLAQVGSELLLNTLPKLFNEEITPKPQHDEEATFAYNIKREQEEIDWNKSQADVYNHIRGLHPWPVAYTIYHDKNLKVWWAEKCKQVSEKTPGMIIDIEDDGIVVATGDGQSVKITELQVAGKKRVQSADFLRGSKDFFEIGTKLG
ncbi:methionyl-tRNA formyltransferase [Tenuibacillus multivorans]|uniref:Methionyl-tRNA formyltransferase n=1 Tax=Tenuibacillus multivorans TaxID=237069 RepID=A0A1G9Y316_9BACI|nr:methionyl-tRNA formyltransferase [Tenuibacillus multivorans]GEL75927.1 methionyl-tRNA formyltransferase [Tenuibacillus multivorans]SDN03407.1 methionyl-tRNA formyltransferase [Tenuibacillus multivorans]